MANVFTKKYHRPRTLHLRDFGVHDPTKTITLPQLRSPTRLGNPHPQGLVYQDHKGKSDCGIWNPIPNRNYKSLPAMVNHLKWVNFSCGPVVISPKQRGKPPDIKYTENTISRSSYKDPKRLPHLKVNLETTRYACKPQTKATQGIVPIVKPKAYRPVDEIEGFFKDI